jgi:hypothetical protein
MHSLKVKWLSISLLAAVAASATPAFSQTQNQSIWQKIKNSAKQAGQNTAQQGSQQVQQGVDQGASAIGNQINGAAQPQTPCGSLTAGNPGGATLNNAAFNGSAGNVGSCGQNCFNAGPFAAAISQMTMSQQNGWHIIRMQVQFHNASNQPLAIAYHDGSMVMVDELGNTYQGAGGNPGEVQGMGIDRGGQTDPQFVLGPGQTGSALFSVARYRPNTSAIGTAFNYNFTVDELQQQNGAEALVARQYNLNFPNLSAGSSGGAFPAAAPTNAFAGGGNVAPNSSPTQGMYGGAAPAGSKGAAIGSAMNRRAAAPARQSGAVNPQMGVASAPATRAQPIQRTVNNAALTTRTNTAAKPAPAARALPTKPAAKKTADNTSAPAK